MSNLSRIEPLSPEAMTLRQTAALCAVSERTLWGWANTGISPAPLRIGKGTVRYSRAAYLAWITGGCPRCDGGQGHE